jgi:membrane protease subunit (stomatin/prohibitin family)
MGVTDIASKLTDIEQFVLDRAKDHYELYGIEVQKLSGLYVSMPEEVQKAVDTRSAMQVTGTDYMTLKTGSALEGAANNPSGGGGLAGMGVGLGAGAGMGYMMMDTMARSQGAGGAQGQAPAGAPGTTTACIKCQAMIPTGTKFCPKCGAAQGMACPSCGAVVSAGDKFCGDCGAKVGALECPSCGKPVEAGDRYCPQCGHDMG